MSISSPHDHTRVPSNPQAEPRILYSSPQVEFDQRARNTIMYGSRAASSPSD